MAPSHRLVLIALSGAVLALGGTAFAQVRIDTKAKPELPQCTLDVIKTSDCHIHDSGTHIQLSVNQPTADRPHAQMEYQEWMRDQHRR